MNTYITPFMRADANGKLTPVTLNGVAFKLTPTFMETLNIISQTNRLFFYGAASKSSSLTISLTPVLLSDHLNGIEIQYGGHRMRYFNGPQFQQKFKWPDAVNDGKVLVTLYLRNGQHVEFKYYGLWGLITLLSQINYDPNKGLYYWQFSGNKAYFKVSPVGRGNINVLQAIPSFSCISQ